MKDRRNFLKKVTIGTTGMAMAGTAMGMPAKSYSRIIGANDRLHVAIAGLGRRIGAFYAPIARPESNVELVYLCDVMKKQRDRALTNFAKHIDYKPKAENDIRKVIEDKNVDILRSEEHTSELQSRGHLVCRLLLE